MQSGNISGPFSETQIQRNKVVSLAVGLIVSSKAGIDVQEKSVAKPSKDVDLIPSTCSSSQKPVLDSTAALGISPLSFPSFFL
jgi:hypothetical protein